MRLHPLRWLLKARTGLCVYYASSAKLIQGSNWGGGTAGTASLFRCQLKQAVPEA
jgi:hypothetical protein